MDKKVATGNLGGFDPDGIDKMMSLYRKWHDVFENNKSLEQVNPQIKELLASEPTESELRENLTSGSLSEKIDMFLSMQKRHREIKSTLYLANEEMASKLNVLAKYSIKSLSAKDIEDIAHKHIQEVSQTAGLSDAERTEKVTAKVEAEMRSHIEKDAGYSALSVDQKAQLEQELKQTQKDLLAAAKGSTEREQLKQKIEAKQKELEGLREERDRLGEQKTKQEALLHQVEQRHSAKEAEALSTTPVDAAAPADTGASSKVTKREAPPSTKTANAAATGGAEVARPKTQPPKPPRSPAPTPIPKPR